MTQDSLDIGDLEKRGYSQIIDCSAQIRHNNRLEIKPSC
jgi:hypothetical protein